MFHGIFFTHKLEFPSQKSLTIYTSVYFIKQCVGQMKGALDNYEVSEEEQEYSSEEEIEISHSTETTVKK